MIVVSTTFVEFILLGTLSSLDALNLLYSLTIIVMLVEIGKLVGRNSLIDGIEIVSRAPVGHL